MGIIAWVIFGALAGWLASMITGNNQQQGAIGNIIVGILGAIVGGWLAGLIFDAEVTGFNLPSLIIAVLGAVLLLVIKNALAGKPTA